MPTKALLGTTMAELNSEQVKLCQCPFTGEVYHAVSATNADIALIHAYAADEYGNVVLRRERDNDDIDQLIARATGKMASVEELVPHEVVLANPRETWIPRIWVQSVVHLPYGAHPSACDGYYDEDDGQSLNMSMRRQSPIEPMPISNLASSAVKIMRNTWRHIRYQRLPALM